MLKYIDSSNPINKIEDSLMQNMILAQNNLVASAYSTSGDLCGHVFSELKIACSVPSSLFDCPVETITNLPFPKLSQFYSNLLRTEGLPAQAIPLQSINLAQRTQLVQAFHDPDEVLTFVQNKVAKIVDKFPKNISDIERGRNPGDVIDPYILAATQYLMYEGDFDKAISATVAHKALMMIEGLIGHLHEDVIGMMRGNVRIPEPRGKDQETLDPTSNPFPGADIIQPPWNANQPLKFHQIKNKTGSAKGGDGRRLGEQLRKLTDLYGGEIYYHALIGNTLKGHRSKAGVERAAPEVIVLVGRASFEELTGSNIGPQLLLRVYQSAFMQVVQLSGYAVEKMAGGIVETFQSRATDSDRGLLELILDDVTDGHKAEQDSRLYNSNRKKRKK